MPKRKTLSVNKKPTPPDKQTEIQRLKELTGRMLSAFEQSLADLSGDDDGSQ